ncbi:response regulator [Vreelandella alkaliphila]|uniref:Response regulator n=1 Tax=Vreelandella alkaliphila TaxID=272774 RepID=A0A7C9NQ03_9GAMM|nr:response regulator [Halomonas alkaliphila]NDL70708.1 response regulator [Halomonas alkaliphila]
MTTTPATLMVVDDDLEIRELLADYLGRHGYQVLTADGADSLYQQLAKQTPDLLIVDVMMPGDDGFTICRELRKTSDIPIIMLTASADDTDRVLGLELGADDYIAKPFNPRELLARIKAVLRRARPAAATVATAQEARRVRFGDWQLDRMTRELIDQEGIRTALSGADFQLLQVFLERPATVITRDDLYTLTRGREAPPLDRSIDVHVCRLRQRLGEDAQHSQLIRTVRGAGYVLTAKVEPTS